MSPHQPRSAWRDGAFTPDPDTLSHWVRLNPGLQVAIVKRRPDGTDAYAYDGVVVPTPAPAPWIAIEATWTLPQVIVEDLAFMRGDTIVEFFSPEHAFNAFLVVAPDGKRRGWYGNITYPAFLYPGSDVPTIVWHDLVLDAIVVPGHEPVLLDDDELDDEVILGDAPGLRDALVPLREQMLAFICERDRDDLSNE